MAAKKIKYLTIHGTGKVAVHDREGLKAAREEIQRLTAASPVLMGQQGFSCFGTGSIYDLMDSRRMMPTDNFRKTHFDQAHTLNAHAFKKKYDPGKHGCMGCHIRCKKIARTGGQEGVSMPEFETMSHFTALIGNTDMERVIEGQSALQRLRHGHHLGGGDHRLLPGTVGEQRYRRAVAGSAPADRQRFH